MSSRNEPLLRYRSFVAVYWACSRNRPFFVLYVQLNTSQICLPRFISLQCESAEVNTCEAFDDDGEEMGVLKYKWIFRKDWQKNGLFSEMDFEKIARF